MSTATTKNSKIIVLVDNTHTETSRFTDRMVMCLKTYNITFARCRSVHEIKRIDKENFIMGYILSGSELNVHEVKNDPSLKYICDMNEFAIESGKPVFAVCFGAQFVYTYFNGKLNDLGSVHCKTLTSNIVGYNIENTMYCARYMLAKPNEKVGKHVKMCGTVLIDGVEHDIAFYCTRYRIVGVMFHPEQYTHTHCFIEEFAKQANNLGQQQRKRK